MSRDPAFLEECVSLANALREEKTMSGLRGCAAWADLEPRLAKLLGTIRRFEPAMPPDEAPDPSRVMAVTWNIEHGNRYPQILAALRDHPQLQDADLILLQEVDLGMARSANRDVAQELGLALDRNVVWAPLFLETTVGRDDDLALVEGRENLEGLFGQAILSRWPIGEARIVELPSPADIQYDTEGMYGRHIALVAAIERPGGPFTAVCVHLEVHRTRAFRAKQMKVLMDDLARRGRPVLLGGDFNSSTFDRGRWWDPLAVGAALAFTPNASLEQRLLHPDRGPRRERLFDVLRDASFEWHALNDRRPTLKLRLSRLPETKGSLGRAIPPGMLQRMEMRAMLKLDWLVGRDWLRGRGATVGGLDGPGRASDHAPILAELK